MEEKRNEWTQENMLEVRLDEPDDFLKIRETLSRIGVSSRKGDTKNLYQSCHILHKRGKYYIVHFKELFLLDRKESNLTHEDIQRRNRIALFLEDWGLLTVCDRDFLEDVAPASQITIIPFSEKSNWNLITKYSIGKSKK